MRHCICEEEKEKHLFYVNYFKVQIFRDREYILHYLKCWVNRNLQTFI